MRNMVKFGFIAAVLSLISCSNDFPPAPEFAFCKLPDESCEPVQHITRSDCETLGGEIVNTCAKGTD